MNRRAWPLALLLTLVVALAAAPFAAVWAISHARVEDYLGPHRVSFASNFTGEIELNRANVANPITHLLMFGGGKQLKSE